MFLFLQPPKEWRGSMGGSEYFLFVLSACSCCAVKLRCLVAPCSKAVLLSNLTLMITLRCGWANFNIIAKLAIRNELAPPFSVFSAWN